MLEFPCLMPCLDLDGIDVPVYSQAVGKLMGTPGFLTSNCLEFEIREGVCEDYNTFTQGGWGTNCNGNNPGCTRDANFDSVFPNGLVLGDQDGGDDDEFYALELTSSAAVADLLPNGGPSSPLSSDEVDESSSSAGVLAGQLVAATLNVEFDAAGVFGSPGNLGELVYIACVVDGVLGLSVNELLDIANGMLSGETPTSIEIDGDTVTINDVSDALTVLNENFIEGANDGCLQVN